MASRRLVGIKLEGAFPVTKQAILVMRLHSVGQEIVSISAATGTKAARRGKRLLQQQDRGLHVLLAWILVCHGIGPSYRQRLIHLQMRRNPSLRVFAS